MNLKAADQIVVAFTGEGSGTEEMSWGQWEIWLAMVNQQSSLPIGGSATLAAGTTVDDVAEELRYLMSRYQSMRTRLTFDDAGRPKQVLFSQGEIALEIFEAGEIDPAEVAALVHEQYTTEPFGYADQWPVRMAVVRHNGELTHLIAIMSHLTADGFGGMVMLDEVAKRVTAPVEGMQPMEQARWQRSPAGQKHNEAAMRHWERLLRTVPVGQLGDGTDPREPRYWEGRLRSRALCLAVRAIGERTKVDSSAILLALFALAVFRSTGISPFFTRPVVSNRFRPHLSNVVCMLAQAGLCVIDVAGVGVDEAVRRAQRSAMTAYKHAYFDPEQLKSLLDSLTAERGPEFSVSCFFNDRRGGSRADATGAAPTSEELAEALAESTFAWITAQETPFDWLFLHIDDVPDLLQLTVAFDTQHVSPGRAEGILRSMQEIAIAAAFDPNYKVDS